MIYGVELYAVIWKGGPVQLFASFSRDKPGVFSFGVLYEWLLALVCVQIIIRQLIEKKNPRPRHLYLLQMYLTFHQGEVQY